MKHIPWVGLGQLFLTFRWPFHALIFTASWSMCYLIIWVWNKDREQIASRLLLGCSSHYSSPLTRLAAAQKHLESYRILTVDLTHSQDEFRHLFPATKQTYTLPNMVNICVSSLFIHVYISAKYILFPPTIFLTVFSSYHSGTWCLPFWHMEAKTCSL